MLRLGWDALGNLAGGKRIKGRRFAAAMWVLLASCNAEHDAAKDDHATLESACRELCRKDAECGSARVAVPCADDDCVDCERACVDSVGSRLDLDDEFCTTLFDATVECARNATCAEFRTESGADCERAARARSACYELLTPPTPDTAATSTGFVGPATSSVSTTGFPVGTPTISALSTGPLTSAALTSGSTGSGGSATTTGGDNPWLAGECGDVRDFFVDQCGTSVCHGNPGSPSEDHAMPYLFPEDPVEFVGVPGEVCSDELLVDPDNPSQSLLVSTLRGTSECDVVMPSVFLQLPESDIACVEAWVTELATRDTE